MKLCVCTVPLLASFCPEHMVDLQERRPFFHILLVQRTCPSMQLSPLCCKRFGTQSSLCFHCSAEVDLLSLVVSPPVCRLRAGGSHKLWSARRSCMSQSVLRLIFCSDHSLDAAMGPSWRVAASTRCLVHAVLASLRSSACSRDLAAREARPCVCRVRL